MRINFARARAALAAAPLATALPSIALLVSGLLMSALLMTALASPACAADNRNVFLEELTWTELRGRVAAGATTIIVPIGGTEQSGPHIALGKHNARVVALSAKIAAQLGNALVAPVIAYVPEGDIDPPSGHMRFPGTISISPQLFELTLQAAGRSFKHS